MIELAALLVLGIMAQWIAWKVKLPAIFPLIVIGLIMGPISTLINDGEKLIDPLRIFEGNMMYYFVSLSVGIILFEGGLTLKFKEVRNLAGTVRNLLFFDTIIMCLGGAVATHYILGWDWSLAFLFGALIIVTGPTVINPILQAVQPSKKVSAVLKWEGILIDPIGAIVAVIIFEIFFGVHQGVHTEMSTMDVMKAVFTMVSVGALFGLAFGQILAFLLRKDLIPHYLINVFALAMVVLCFAASEVVKPEAGLLAVTVMGMFLANTKAVPNLEKILDFKESITVILISVLFIMLSAHIDMEQIKILQGKSFLVFLIAILILRPIAIFLSDLPPSLTIKEKLFISWIGPKGIVAAAIASLFTLYLNEKETLPFEIAKQAEMLLPLTFFFILGTVVLNGLFSKRVARLLGVTREESNGFLLVGANRISIAIAKYLESIQLPVTLVDANFQKIQNAQNDGLNAIQKNLLAPDVNEQLEYVDAGNMLALTASSDINLFAEKNFAKMYGERQVNRLITENEIKLETLTKPENILFGLDADILKLSQICKRFPTLTEYTLRNAGELGNILANNNDNLIPIFIRSAEKVLTVITIQMEREFAEGDVLVYAGENDFAS